GFWHRQTDWSPADLAHCPTQIRQSRRLFSAKAPDLIVPQSAHSAPLESPCRYRWPAASRGPDLTDKSAWVPPEPLSADRCERPVIGRWRPLFHQKSPSWQPVVQSSRWWL